MTFPTKLFPLAVLALAACDVAPRPIDLDRSFIQTPDEGYQFFIDTVIGSNTARQIAKGCAAYDFDQPKRDRQMTVFETQMERLAVTDPATLDQIHRRLGVPVTAQQIAEHGYDGLEGAQITTGYLLRNAGVTLDVGSRAIGMLVRGGLVDDCDDAAREIAQGTMAGSFLRPMQMDQPGGLTVSVPEALRVDAPELTGSPQVIQPVN